MPAPQLVNRVSTPTFARPRHLIEISLAVVAVEPAGISDEMGLEQVQMPIEVVVANADAHAGLLHAIVAERNAAHHAFFAKRAVMIVHEQQARGGIAGHEDVGPAIFVEIGGDHGHSVALGGSGDAGLFGHVGECAIAVVAIERMPSRGQSPRTAIHRNPFPIAVEFSPGAGACSNENRM